jgi:hypothetical protein
MWLKKTILVIGLALCVYGMWAANGTGAQNSNQQSAAAPNGRQYTPPFYVFSPNVPNDIVTHDVGAIGFQPFVDILAWDSFIALNWPVPAQLTQRGVPDQQNLIGGFKTSGGEGGGGTTLPTGPTVWETYKDTADIFLNPPVHPTSFDAPEIIPPACLQLAASNRAAARRTMTQTAKVSDVLQDFKQAFTLQPLIDQNGEKVWYEVKVNRAYYDYVVKNGFYNSKNQTGKISFPSSSNTTNTVPAIKIKAAWKIMGGPGSKQPDDPTKFYTTVALVYDPETGKCTARTVGLVGLHIVMKTALLPQWSWATFEHVNNAPDQSGAVSGVQYNFYNPNCPSCPINTPPPKSAPNTPTQVMRLVPVAMEANAPNMAYQTALKMLRADNVWQNYMLVDDQWSGTATPVGVPSQPKYLANSTLETYLQQPVNTTPPHGCINCHGKYAGTKDLDFQLFKAYPHTPNLVRNILQAHGDLQLLQRQ